METLTGRIMRLVADGLAVDPAKLCQESHLSLDLGADALDVVQLIMALEADFGIRIDDAALPELRTLGDVTRHVQLARAENS